MSKPDDELRDVELEDEIALVGELVAAAAGDEPLSSDEIDRALGVDGTQRGCAGIA